MTTIEQIARGVGISSDDARSILARGPVRYKVYQIPKRSGGWRIISQPSRELKAVQRYLLASFFSHLRITNFATAYRTGVSIRDNAAAHAGNPYLLKLDFRSFFHSFRPSDMDYVLRINGITLSKPEVLTLKLATYWRPKGSSFFMFAMGAPTSPTLTNAMMYELDEMIGAFCAARAVTFTRYADDLAFSGGSSEALLAVEKFVRKQVSESGHPKLQLNDGKRGMYGPGQKKIVTGLVITPAGDVSISRERKRAISAGVHWWKTGQITTELHREQLRGLLAFAKSAEPEFLGRLSQKYGPSTIENILKRKKIAFWSPGQLPWSREDFFPGI
jgi:hypothetical protein